MLRASIRLVMNGVAQRMHSKGSSTHNAVDPPAQRGRVEIAEGGGWHLSGHPRSQSPHCTQRDSVNRSSGLESSASPEPSSDRDWCRRSKACISSCRPRPSRMRLRRANPHVGLMASTHAQVIDGGVQRRALAILGSLAAAIPMAASAPSLPSRGRRPTRYGLVARRAPPRLRAQSRVPPVGRARMHCSSMQSEPAGPGRHPTPTRQTTLRCQTTPANGQGTATLPESRLRFAQIRLQFPPGDTTSVGACAPLDRQASSIARRRSNVVSAPRIRVTHGTVRTDCGAGAAALAQKRVESDLVAGASDGARRTGIQAACASRHAGCTVRAKGAAIVKVARLAPLCRLGADALQRRAEFSVGARREIAEGRALRASSAANRQDPGRGRNGDPRSS